MATANAAIDTLAAALAAAAVGPLADYWFEAAPGLGAPVRTFAALVAAVAAPQTCALEMHAHLVPHPAGPPVVALSFASFFGPAHARLAIPGDALLRRPALAPLRRALRGVLRAFRRVTRDAVNSNVVRFADLGYGGDARLQAAWTSVQRRVLARLTGHALRALRDRAGAGRHLAGPAAHLVLHTVDGLAGALLATTRVPALGRHLATLTTARAVLREAAEEEEAPS